MTFKEDENEWYEIWSTLWMRLAVLPNITRSIHQIMYIQRIWWWYVHLETVFATSKVWFLNCMDIDFKNNVKDLHPIPSLFLIEKHHLPFLSVIWTVNLYCVILYILLVFYCLRSIRPADWAWNFGEVATTVLPANFLYFIEGLVLTISQI